MPEMTGLQLYEKVKEIKPHIPFLICTGHSQFIANNSPEYKEICFVGKPVSIAEISRNLRTMLDK
jgi:YesN/AraC family two-component response regulator